MSRSLIVVMAIIVLMLIAATSAAAQSRGHFGGGFRSGSVFNAPPVVRPGGPIVPTRPPIAVARPPFAGSPFHRPPVAAGRPVRPVIVAPAFAFYSPYVWPSPIYGGLAYPYYSAPLFPDQAYLGPPTEVPAPSQN